MSSRISQQQLESYLWGTATLLRGTIDAGDYKQFIFPLLFYKRLCDVFDEEMQAALKESGGDESFAAYPENHRFQIPSEAHWRNVREAAKNVGKALQSAMRTIETANPDKLYGIFGDAQWTNKDRLWWGKVKHTARLCRPARPLIRWHLAAAVETLRHNHVTKTAPQT